jgi:hypothetical protein
VSEALRRLSFAALFSPQMARETKKMELRPVEDIAEDREPVIRLGSNEPQPRERPVRLVPEAPVPSHRLDVPAREEVESRTHQPGIEELMDRTAANPDLEEQAWAKNSFHRQNVPWGWFMLFGTLLAAAVIWSLNGVKKAVVQAQKIRVTTESIIDRDAQEDQEASDLIVRIDAATRKFFETTDVRELARLVRHPERVTPLMQAYYGGKSVPAHTIRRTNILQPVTLGSHGNFWIETVELSNHQSRNLLIEILDSGEPRIDWETLVCYQPMKWDTFVSERPASTTLDFRVYAEHDTFFSHEFSDSNTWNCFRLTTLDSEETLFGYAKKTEQASRDILEILNQSQGKRASIILRISIPEGLQSRRGVVIEKMLSPRWLYIDPPDSGS